MQDEPLTVECYREYLLMLARIHLRRLRCRMRESDVVQETMLKAHQRAEQFRGTTSGERAAWLRQILTNEVANAARAEKQVKRDVRREQSLDQAIEGSSAWLEAWLIDGRSSPSERAVRNEQLLRLAGALAALPESWREAVEMRHLQGMTLRQIAEEMGRTLGAVAGLLRSALKALRAEMEKS